MTKQTSEKNIIIETELSSYCVPLHSYEKPELPEEALEKLTRCITTFNKEKTILDISVIKDKNEKQKYIESVKLFLEGYNVSYEVTTGLIIIGKKIYNLHECETPMEHTIREPIPLDTISLSYSNPDLDIDPEDNPYKFKTIQHLKIINYFEKADVGGEILDIEDIYVDPNYLFVVKIKYGEYGECFNFRIELDPENDTITILRREEIPCNF